MSDPAHKTPVEALIARAVSGFCPGDELSVVTDVDSYAKSKNKPPAVLVGIARAKYAVAVAIDASEYDALELARLAGWEYSRSEPTAMERATAALDASSKRR